MSNGEVFIKKLVLMSVGVMMMTMLVTTARADDEVTRSHDFDLDGIEEVEFRSTVGSFEIIPTRGDELRVVLEIEGNKRGFFRRSTDVSDMDLESRERGDTLILEFEEENANANWIVEMPRTSSVERTSIQMGVGEVNVEIGGTELEVELGVGDVDINAPEDSVGRINLNVGVGDASMRGGEVIDHDAMFISQSIEGEGNGTFDMEVDVGVGDISVRLD